MRIRIVARWIWMLLFLLLARTLGASVLVVVQLQRGQYAEQGMLEVQRSSAALRADVQALASALRTYAQSARPEPWAADGHTLGQFAPEALLQALARHAQDDLYAQGLLDRLAGELDAWLYMGRQALGLGRNGQPQRLAALVQAREFDAAVQGLQASIGALEAHLLERLQARDLAADTVAHGAALATLLTLLCSLLTMALLWRSYFEGALLRPLLDLTRATRAFLAGDRSVGFVRQAHAEVDELATTLEDWRHAMLETEHQRWAHEKLIQVVDAMLQEDDTEALAQRLLGELAAILQWDAASLYLAQGAGGWVQWRARAATGLWTRNQLQDLPDHADLRFTLASAPLCWLEQPAPDLQQTWLGLALPQAQRLVSIQVRDGHRPLAMLVVVLCRLPSRGMELLLQALGARMAARLQRLQDEAAAQRAALQAQQQAQYSSAFLAQMSHEIRTPLNSILGLGRLAMEGSASPAQRDYLQKIMRSGQHLLGVINDVLDLSRMEAGKLELERVAFALDAVLGTLSDMLHDRALDKGLDLQLAVAADVPPVLLGDPRRLSQVLINYVGNALTFTESGSVCIRVSQQVLNDTELLLRFEVSDTGMGLSPQQMERLFQSFSQADRSIGRRYGGSGPGLAIAESLARQMGGEVGVHSLTGQGATFWFTARLGRLQQTALAPPRLPSPGQMPGALGSLSAAQRLSLQGRRILLVEDHEVNQQVARELLQSAGVVVVLADDGLAALRILQQQKFDLVLMDLQMPQMDGLEVTRVVRRHAQLQQLPIVAMTANVLPADRQRCAEAGMQGFVAKPIDPAEMWAELLRCLPACVPATQAAAPPAGGEGLGGACLVPLSVDTLRGLPGVQVQAALQRVAGNTALYLRLLTVWLRRQQSQLEQLRTSLEQAQWLQAGRQVHAYKGSAANLGLESVAVRAAALQAGLPGADLPGLTGEPMQAQAQPLLQQWQALEQEAQRTQEALLAHWPLAVDA